MILSGNCSVCNENQAKYKCPHCRAPYCCVACCKAHKEGASCASATLQPRDTPEKVTSLAGQLSAGNRTQTSSSFATEDTVQPDKLALLGESSELRAVLSNPHLRNIISWLDQAKSPEEAERAMEAAMQEPIFTEFADVCLGIVAPQTEQ